MQSEFTDVPDNELLERLHEFRRMLSALADRLKSRPGVPNAIRAQRFSDEVKAVIREVAEEDPDSMQWILQNSEIAVAIEDELQRRAVAKN